MQNRLQSAVYLQILVTDEMSVFHKSLTVSFTWLEFMSDFFALSDICLYGMEWRQYR